mmetsp:Transcript_10717/g.11987  ORF Transcript_10717/g.11987 Transcript_10717/m.11987 type:complete len:242 (+) Transcript_10717:408-1133(+)
MEMVFMTVSLNRVADSLALAVLHPRGESGSLAWASSLYAKRSFKALVDLALTIDHELFICDGKVAQGDDAIAVIVTFAMTFAMAVAVAVCVAMSVAVITMAFIITVMHNGLRFEQILFEHRCARILVFIRILDAVTNVVAVHGLVLDINVQLILAMLSAINDDRLPFLIQRPMRIAWMHAAYAVILAIASELNRGGTLWVLELPFRACTVSKEQLLDRAQSPEVKSLSPPLRVHLMESVAL